MTCDGPRRIVVKVGTSTLTDARGRIDRGYIADLAAQLAEQRSEGRDVVLVTSGAIRAGRERLEGRPSRAGEPECDAASAARGVSGGPSKSSLPYKQAAAAVGQGLLMHTYTEAFAWREVTCAQILLTREDLADRHRFLNARRTLLTLLSLGAVPIINENDTVAVDEIKFGDNDTLAALVATLVEADLLVILSDVEGLYAREPDASTTGGDVIRTVPSIDASILALAGGSEPGGVGTGGMRTKIEAARIAASSGIKTIVVGGRPAGAIADSVAGREVGTTFLPQPSKSRLPARKRWIAHTARPRGSVTVNTRARRKLETDGVSLLAVGIVSLAGTFAAGDLIEICDETGMAFARGLVNYDASEVRRVRGLRSDQFEAALGYRGCDEIVHRDNLVIGA